MATIRRLLNVLAGAIIVGAGVVLGLFAQRSFGGRIPATAIFMLALPVVAQVVGAVWAWPRFASFISSGKALYGIALSGASMFAWVVLTSATAELSLATAGSQPRWDVATLLLGSFLLAAASAVNLAFFCSAASQDQPRHVA